MEKQGFRGKFLILLFAIILFSAAGCSGPKEALFQPGSYTAEAMGKEGAVKVSVDFSENRIKSIEILEQNETKGLGDKALETLKERIIDNQSLAVDAVSGASHSSNALIEAVALAILQAGGDPAAFSGAVPAAVSDKTEEYDADIVVIGAGASGISAAVAAADKGAKVIIIEKTGIIGGASNLSWAGKFYNSPPAVESGLVVDEEKTIADWIVNNHWRVNAAAVRQYVVRSRETWGWLSDHGYPTRFLNFFGEQLHMLPPYEDRENLMRTMLAQSVEKNGGLIMTSTTAKELITDSAGNVTGAVAFKEDGTRVIASARAVIIATGGYAANAEMVKDAFGFEGLNGGLGQNVGEGLKMAWAAGAGVPDNFGGQMLHQTLARATADLKQKFGPFEASYPLMAAYLPNFMNVGPTGSRFRDEAATLTSVAAANTSAFNGPYHLVIVSADQMKALESDGMKGIHAPKLPGMPPKFYAVFKDRFTLDQSWTGITEVFDAMVAGGNGFKGETVEELARNAGMDSEVFAKNFASYRKAVAEGKDSEFGKDAAYLEPMGDSGPYYAVIAEINNLGSVGGLLVNTEFQVLNDGHVPIKGLYAVGLESEGVLFNDTYVGNGVGIGYAFTSGKLGGAYCADDVLNL